MSSQKHINVHRSPDLKVSSVGIPFSSELIIRKHYENYDRKKQPGGRASNRSTTVGLNNQSED